MKTARLQEVEFVASALKAIAAKKEYKKTTGHDVRVVGKEAN